MAVALNMDGNQIGNGAPGVASTDFVVVSQMKALRDSILAEVGGGVIDRSQSAEMLLIGLESRFLYKG